MHSFNNYNSWIGSEVITETGVFLGWVRKVVSNFEDSTSAYLVMTIMPMPWMPKILIGAYEISINEVVSAGSNRLIVFDGAEARIKHSTVGWLERFIPNTFPWQKVEIITPTPSLTSLVTHSGVDDTWDDEPGTGLSPVPIPRRPNPSPMDHEAGIPSE